MEKSKNTNLINFTIDLQEGFYDDNKVIIKVDKQNVYTGIPKTDLSLGVATSFECNSNSELIEINIIIKKFLKDINITKSIDLRKGKAIGIASSGKITQAESFIYE